MLNSSIGKMDRIFFFLCTDQCGSETDRLDRVFAQCDRIVIRHGSVSQYYCLRQCAAVQSHEFMNKLHVIYGLADLKAYDELKIYLDDILTPEKSSLIACLFSSESASCWIFDWRTSKVL